MVCHSQTKQDKKKEIPKVIFFVLTSMDLQTPATAWQAAEVGKSMGKLGRPRIETRGSSPFWLTNS